MKSEVQCKRHAAGDAADLQIGIRNKVDSLANAYKAIENIAYRKQDTK